MITAGDRALIEQRLLERTGQHIQLTNIPSMRSLEVRVPGSGMVVYVPTYLLNDIAPAVAVEIIVHALYVRENSARALRPELPMTPHEPSAFVAETVQAPSIDDDVPQHYTPKSYQTVEEHDGAF